MAICGNIYSHKQLTNLYEKKHEDSIICTTSPTQLDVLIEKGFWASVQIAEWRRKESFKPRYLYLYAPKRYYYELSDDRGGFLIERFAITEIYLIPGKAEDEGKCIIFVDSQNRERKHISFRKVQGRIYEYSKQIEKRNTDL